MAGTVDPVYPRLRGDAHSRWGETLRRSGERGEQASVSIERVS